MTKTDTSLRETLELTMKYALQHLENLERMPVAATVDTATLRQRLGKLLTDDGVAADEVIEELARDVEGGLIGTAGGRFFAFVIGGALPAALGADWLASAWDQNAAAHVTSLAAAITEEVVGAWLKDVLRLPPDASFALVTGAQMAHATCLAAARNAVLGRKGWNVEEQGLFGAPPIRILTGSERHGTVDRAVRLLGLGLGKMIALPVDNRGWLRADALESALAADPAAPTIVVLQAGDINIGAFDPFRAIVPIAKRHGAWMHVDGAIGLWANASPRYRHFAEGIEGCDSWTTDGHKWLNVPYDCGYAFVAHPEPHRASMAYRAPYWAKQDGAREQLDWNPEWSRRARGFATYAALRQLGRNGIAELVDGCCAHAHALVTRIGALPGAELVWTPTLNQGLVRFPDPRPNATEADHDRRTDEVIASILATGEAFFGGTVWRGRRAMRVSVSNWRTSERDVDRTVNAVAQVLRDGISASQSV